MSFAQIESLTKYITFPIIWIDTKLYDWERKKEAIWPPSVSKFQAAKESESIFAVTPVVWWPEIFKSYGVARWHHQNYHPIDRRQPRACWQILNEVLAYKLNGLGRQVDVTAYLIPTAKRLVINCAGKSCGYHLEGSCPGLIYPEAILLSCCMVCEHVLRI